MQKAETLQVRRDELIVESIDTLNRKGVSQTSLAEIAAKLGISRPALYYYVKDKQDLVYQSYVHSCKHIENCLLSASNGDTNSTDLENFVSLALDPNVGVFASLGELGCLNADQRLAITGHYSRIVERLAKIIQTGVDSAAFRPCEPTTVARTLLSMVLWAPTAHSWSMALRSAATNTGAAALISLLANGLGHVGTPEKPPFRVNFSTFKPAFGGAFDKAYLTWARREALLTSASWLFNQKGVDATSLEEIAARAGATKRSILHHFGDKQNLIEAVYKRGVELAIYIPETLSNTSLEAAEKLESAFFAVAEASCRPELALATPRVGLEALRPEARAEVEALSDRLTSLYVQLLSAARAERTVDDHIDVAGFLVMAAGAWQWLSQGLVDVRPEDEVGVARQISRLLMSGLVVRP